MTSKDKWLQASLLLSSTAVIVVGVLSGTLAQSNFMSASVLQYEIGSTVKIEPTSNFPDINISQIEAGQSVSDSATCQGKDFISRYYKGSKARYNQTLTLEATCLRGRQNATYIADQIADNKKSLESVTAMIGVVQKLLDSANAKEKNLVTRASVVIIPAGFEGGENYAFADNIDMKCLKQGKEVVTAKIGVGTGSEQIGTVFKVSSKELEDELILMKTENAKTNKIVQGYKVAGKSIPIGTISGIFLDLMALRGKMANKFVAILPEDLHTYYPDIETKNNYITMTMDFDIKDGKLIKVNDQIPWIIKNTMSTFGIKGDFVSGTITLDGAKYETFLPIQYMLSDNTKVSNAHLTRLKALKERYENLLTQNMIKLKTLADKKYNCPS